MIPVIPGPRWNALQSNKALPTEYPQDSFDTLQKWSLYHCFQSCPGNTQLSIQPKVHLKKLWNRDNFAQLLVPFPYLQKRPDEAKVHFFEFKGDMSFMTNFSDKSQILIKCNWLFRILSHKILQLVQSITLTWSKKLCIANCKSSFSLSQNAY